MPIIACLYEDNNLLRESISSLLSLQNVIKMVLSKEHTNDILEDLKKHAPNLILMDIEMPGRSGIDAVKLIRSQGHKMPVIMLTIFEDNENVLQAIQAGASGYLLKKHISSRLFQSIEDVLEGGAPMSPSVAKMVVASMQKTNKDLYQLTEREKSILSELSKGNSYKLIAANFKISIDTVRSHIKHIYEKLQVHSQTEAVSKAINEGLV